MTINVQFYSEIIAKTNVSSKVDRSKGETSLMMFSPPELS